MMDEKRDNLFYTFLDTMKRLHIINCHYYYCSKCDQITFEKENERLILEELKKAKNNEKIRIVF